MANPSTGRVKTPVTHMTYSITRAEANMLVFSERRIFTPRGKSVSMNVWAGQRVWHPSAVFGTSHVGSLPLHLAYTPLPLTCVVFPQEAQVCSLRAPHTWLAVATAPLGAARNKPLNLQRFLLQPKLVIHKYDFTPGTKSQNLFCEVMSHEQEDVRTRNLKFLASQSMPMDAQVCFSVMVKERS